MEKKKITFIGIVIAIIAVVVLIVSFLGDEYSNYESAHNKLFKTGSVECDFTADINIDNKNIKSTGNMKIKNENGKMIFFYEGNINGEKVIQFTDGTYVYQERNGQKTKFEIGQKTQHSEKAAFDMDMLEQEFANLIDVSKIKEIQIMEKIDKRLISEITESSDNTGKIYNITFDPKITENIIQVLVNEQLDGEANIAKPQFELNKFTYKASENKSGILNKVSYFADLDMTLPGELINETEDKKMPLEINITMDAVNPGETINVELPNNTDEYVLEK